MALTNEDFNRITERNIYTLLTQYTAMSKEPNMQTNTSIKLKCTIEAIDFDEIASDLTRSNPVAYVKFGTGFGWLVVHRTLAQKAHELGMDVYRKMNDLYDGHIKIHCPNTQAKKQWIKHLKAVKKAEWLGEKGEVTITQVEI